VKHYGATNFKTPGEKGILLTILQTLLSLKRYGGDGPTNARSD